MRLAGFIAPRVPDPCDPCNAFCSLFFPFATTKPKVFVSHWATDWWRTWEVNFALICLSRLTDSSLGFFR